MDPSEESQQRSFEIGVIFSFLSVCDRSHLFQKKSLLHGYSFGTCLLAGVPERMKDTSFFPASMLMHFVQRNFFDNNGK